MEDISSLERQTVKIVDIDYPREADYNTSFNMTFVIDYIGPIYAVLRDKIIVKLYNRDTGALIDSKNFEMHYFSSNETVTFTARMMGSNRRFRLVVVDDNPWPTVDDVEDGFDFTVMFGAAGGVEPWEPGDPVVDMYCTQKFATFYDGSPINTSISVAGTTVRTNPYGSISLLKGKSYTATAYYGVSDITKTFTACYDGTIMMNIGAVVQPPSVPIPPVPDIPTDPDVPYIPDNGDTVDDDKPIDYNTLLLYGAVFIGAIVIFMRRR